MQDCGQNPEDIIHVEGAKSSVFERGTSDVELFSVVDSFDVAHSPAKQVLKL